MIDFFRGPFLGTSYSILLDLDYGDSSRLSGTQW